MWLGWLRRGGGCLSTTDPSQNYSSDQAGSALRGCRGHTTQPRGQPANYRPLCPPSLSPPGRWGNRGKKPERGEKKEYWLRHQKVNSEYNQAVHPFPLRFCEERRSVRLWFAASWSHPSQPSGRDRSLDPWDQSCVSVCGFMYQPAANFTYKGCASFSVCFLAFVSKIYCSRKAQYIVPIMTPQWDRQCRVLISSSLTFAVTIDWTWIWRILHIGTSRRGSTHAHKYVPNRRSVLLGCGFINHKCEGFSADVGN